MTIIIGIILWIFFFIALEQTIVRSIKKAHREIEEEKLLKQERAEFDRQRDAEQAAK